MLFLEMLIHPLQILQQKMISSLRDSSKRETLFIVGPTLVGHSILMKANISEDVSHKTLKDRKHFQRKILK
jgi:hypothetical protein